MSKLGDLLPPAKGDLNIPAALRSAASPSKSEVPKEQKGSDVKGLPPELTNKEPIQQEEPEKAQEAPKEEKPIETLQEPEKAVETILDPWEPIKSRFKDREPNEVLDEYETLAREREALRLQLAEKETTTKELQERLIGYDAVYDPEFQKHVTHPIQEAKAMLIEICLEDQRLAEEAYAIQTNKDLEPKEKVSKVKALLEENGVAHSDWIRAYKGLQKTVQDAEGFKATYKESRTERQKQTLAKMEADQREREESIRRVHRTATFRAESKLKDMGIDFLPGIEKAREAHLSGVERIISGAGIDQEQEVFYNLLGRQLVENHKDIQAKLKRLADLEAAARSKPSDTPKDNKKPEKGVDTSSIQSKIYGNR